MAEVKGVLVTGMRAFMLGRYGKPAVDQALSKIDPNDASRVSRPFLDGSFYPYGTFDSMASLFHALAPIKPTRGQELGTYLAEYVFKGPYKPMLTKDVGRMVEKIAAIKEFFYRDANTIESTMTGPSSCRVVYRYQNGVRPTRGACRSLGAFWGHALELSGDMKVTAKHSTCVAEGGDRCEFVYSW